LLESIGDEMPAIELGFSDEQLAEIMAPLQEEPIGEDIEPTEPPKKPVSQRGEIFELGPHRLMCGDSTSKDDVDALLCGEKPNLMVTDPPYGVEYDASWRARAGLSDEVGPRTGKVQNDDRADWTETWALFEGAVAYVYHAHIATEQIASCLRSLKLELKALICWAKPKFAISRGHYHHQHEPCWYAVRKGKTASWAGDHSQTTLWQIGLDKNLEGDIKHSTQKPLECMERPIRNHEGDVYDPFLGSGTTLIAAARQGRRCFGLEISPAYCDVIRKRWTAYAKENGLEAGTGAL
jgi:DNA modification methylase